MSTLATTINTYNTRALALGVELETTAADWKLLEAFIRSSGRAMPQVLVVGRRLATQVQAFEEIGADTLGIDASEATVEAAQAAFPNLAFRSAEVQDLELEEFDCIWTENLFSRLPASEFGAAASGLLSSLRPGGLIRLAIRIGEGEQLIDTNHGQVLLRLTTEADTSNRLANLDCSLLNRTPLAADRVGLTYRKEY